MLGQDQDQQSSMALVLINPQQLKLNQTLVHLIPRNPALLAWSFAVWVVLLSPTERSLFINLLYWIWCQTWWLEQVIGVVCFSNILQESPEALVKSRFPVLQMCSRIYVLPKLKDYIITKSLLTYSSHSLCSVGCTQAGMAGIQEASKALLSCPGSVQKGHSPAFTGSAPVKDKGTMCGNDLKR